MAAIRDFHRLKEFLQAGLEANQDSMEEFGEVQGTQVKTYLVETTAELGDLEPLAGPWEPLDAPGWYIATGTAPETPVFIDTASPRVWRIFSLLRANQSDALVDSWVGKNPWLDRCYLTRRQLLFWQGKAGWQQRGLGLKFNDGLTPAADRGYFSLKAWHGADRYLPDLERLLAQARERFAIASVRWQKQVDGEVVLAAEAYSLGKITFNNAKNIDDVFGFSSVLAERYNRSIQEATARREQKLAPFELEFTQEINLEAFDRVVTEAQGPMRLWLVEVESESDFRRYRGVDMHTWDRILLDVGPDYAYLTIPGKGCVNAAPRLATIQGEDNAGPTTILHDGVEVFA